MAWDAFGWWRRSPVNAAGEPAPKTSKYGAEIDDLLAQGGSETYLPDFHYQEKNFHSYVTLPDAGSELYLPSPRRYNGIQPLEQQPQYEPPKPWENA